MQKVIRDKIFNNLESNSMIIINSGEEIIMTVDQKYPFRACSNFLYTANLNEPNCFLVMIKTDTEELTYLLRPSYDAATTTWEGKNNNIDTALTDNIDIFEDVSNLRKIINKHFKINMVVLTDVYDNAVLNLFAGKVASITSYLPFFANLRLIKEAHELDDMKKAIAITAKAFNELLPKMKTFNNEREVMAHLYQTYIANGSDFILSFQPIVASGKNALVLHYHDNNTNLNKDNLLLIDSGCSVNFYASDISRTYPISGKFSEPQKIIYQGLLDIKTQLINMVKVGQTYQSLQDKAELLITELLCDNSILKGTVEENMIKQSYKRFFMHNVGHFLGLDVHDLRNHSLSFEENMVFTIEPGIYIGAFPDIDSKWHNIGIRIEDDILVTKNGHENLSKDIIQDVEAIEKAMQ